MFYIQLIAAIVPAAILLIYIYAKDRLSHEPWRQMLKGVAYGVGAAGLAIVAAQFTGTVVTALAAPLLGGAWELAFVRSAVEALGSAAIPEESAKLLMLWLLLRRGRWFDEHFDGIVYAVCVGLGFAAFENVLYVMGSGEEWLSVSFQRAVFSIPGHFFFAVFMGYYYALVHFHTDERRRLIHQASMWGVPVLLHSLFDAFLFTSDATGSELPYACFLLLCAFMFVRGLRLIRGLRRIDEQYAALQDEFLRDAERYDRYDSQ